MFSSDDDWNLSENTLLEQEIQVLAINQSVTGGGTSFNEKETIFV